MALATFFAATSMLTSSRAEAAGAQYLGSIAAQSREYDAVAVESTSTGKGYWIVTARGQVYAFGDADHHGGMGSRTISARVVDIVATPSGDGYWLLGVDGAVYNFGKAPWRGSMKGRMRAAIVGGATTATGKGYWLISSSGKVFHFGDARWRGTAFGRLGGSKVVGVDSTPTGLGYWLATGTGRVFAFGDAPLRGSMSGRNVVGRVVDIAGSPSGRGYWLLTDRGHIHNFGDATYRGSAANHLLLSPIVSLASARDGGYWFLAAEGAIYTATANGSFVADPFALSTKLATMTSDLFLRINLERNARGLQPLDWDPQLAGLARYWANYMGNTGEFRHQDLASLFRDPIYGTRYRSLRENIYNGTGSWRTAGGAHLSLMSSDAHRATILTPELTSVGVGVACLNGRLWVVQEFGVWLNLPAPTPRATPSREPIVAPNTTGLSC